MGVYCSRHEIQQQASTAVQVNEQLVMLRESLHKTCLQKDVLQTQNNQLGMCH